MREVWQGAVAVVADWFLLRKPPRDAIVDHRELRAMTDAERAAISRLAQTCVAMQRRLGFLAAGEEAATRLAPTERAVLLALAAMVERGDMPVAIADRLAGQQGLRGIDFSGVLTGASRIDAIESPSMRFAVRHSLPDWLAAALLAQFGDDADAVAAALNAPAPRTIRANLLKVSSREDLASRLADRGIDSRPTEHAPHGLRVGGTTDLFRTSEYRDGLFEQQDEASQLAALTTAPPPRGRVLDLCAGSGGKTLALAATMGNRGEILATDVHAGRLQALRERARRAGVSNVRTLSIEEDVWPSEVEQFAAKADRILLDAPCSGVGSWRRRPEARWMLAEPDLVSLRRTQADLLDRALRWLKPGARLVYATCSLLAVENEHQLMPRVSAGDGLEIVRLGEVLGGRLADPIADDNGITLSLRPDRHDCDGFYAGIVRKRR